jgi:uncharacterized membrane protein YkvA (DUF1232 family)
MRQIQMGAPVRPDNAVDREQQSQGKSRWRLNAELLQREILTVWFILKDPETTWYARTIAACVAGYVLSPIQLIPSFIPVIGMMDDVLVLTIGMRAIRAFTPAHVIQRARQRSQHSLKRGENIRAIAVRKTTTVVVTMWLVVTIWLFLRVYRHLA